MASYSASIVCILRGDGTPVGAGIVLDHRRVLTCAHVVNEALGRHRFTADAPQARVSVTVPLRTRGEMPFETSVRAECWRGPVEIPAFGEPEDIAVLELDDGRTWPAGVATARLCALDLRDDHDRSVRLTGFPTSQDDRVQGFTNGLDVNGRIRIDSALQTRVVTGGFSGAGVWDERSSSIVGMLVAKRTRGDATIAYGIPIDVIAKVVNDLQLTTLDATTRAAEPIDRHGELLAEMRRQLRDNPGLSKEVARAIPLADDGHRSVDVLSKHLEAFDEVRAVKLVLEIKQSLGEGRKTGLQPNHLVDFAMALLPLAAGRVIEGQLGTLDEQGAKFVELPLFHETRLEFAMAAADGRPASLRPCAREGHFPAGVYNLQPRPIETGDVDQDHDADVVCRELASRVGLTLTHDFDRRPDEVQKKAFELRLGVFRNKTKRRFYLARWIDKDRSNVDDLDAFAGALSERLSCLPLLALDGTDESFARDEETYLEFCMMLPTKPARKARRS